MGSQRSSHLSTPLPVSVHNEGTLEDKSRIRRENLSCWLSSVDCLEMSSANSIDTIRQCDQERRHWRAGVDTSIPLSLQGVSQTDADSDHETICTDQAKI